MIMQVRIYSIGKYHTHVVVQTYAIWHTFIPYIVYLLKILVLLITTKLFL